MADRRKAAAAEEARTLKESLPGRVPILTHPEPALRDRTEGAAAPGESGRQKENGALSVAIYIALGALTLGLLILAAFSFTGVLAKPLDQTRTPWDLSIVFLSMFICLGMMAVVARRYPVLRARLRKPTGLEAIDRGELLVLATSVPVAVFVSVTAFLAWQGVFTRLGPFPVTPMGPVLLATVGLLVAFAPYGLYQYARERHIRNLDDRFPDFLRDLNEANRVGTPMAKAIRTTAKGDYGALTPEIRRMANQVGWGIPYEEALRIFAERVPTPIITRTTALIVKATRAGGNVSDVLAAAARDAREIKTLEKERRQTMLLYVMIVYVAFGVFLAVTAALQGLLIPSLLSSTRGTGLMSLGNVAFSSRLTLQEFEFIFFGVGLVQALGSGIVAGMMAEGTAAAGLKHSAILAGISLLVLGFLI
ncbi:MAG TPA: type II secretion system F family protein [Candidatus Thermoplasmatota archaeon]|nr:type II secretion system F family protein [Candidatus Thermoplasmatota archaeon]